MASHSADVSAGGNANEGPGRRPVGGVDHSPCRAVEIGRLCLGPEFRR
jgi:hypothetical protein